MVIEQQRGWGGAREGSGQKKKLLGARRVKMWFDAETVANLRDLVEGSGDGANNSSEARRAIRNEHSRRFGHGKA